mgnify:CR=1 FL=1|tara:strand:- start:5410 stop:5712 length:303 start_codon:yes stop_codon:yes gene_type:complete
MTALDEVLLAEQEAEQTIAAAEEKAAALIAEAKKTAADAVTEAKTTAKIDREAALAEFQNEVHQKVSAITSESDAQITEVEEAFTKQKAAMLDAVAERLK